MFDIEQERQRFEARISDDGRWPDSISRNEDGGYVFADTSYAWVRWLVQAKLDNKESK